MISLLPRSEKYEPFKLYVLWILRVSFQISLRLPAYNSMLHFCPNSEKLIISHYKYLVESNSGTCVFTLDHFVTLTYRTWYRHNVPIRSLMACSHCYFSRHLNSNHYGNKSTVFCYFIQTFLNSNCVNSPVMFCPQLGVNTNWNQFTFVRASTTCVHTWSWPHVWPLVDFWTYSYLGLAIRFLWAYPFIILWFLLPRSEKFEP